MIIKSNASTQKYNNNLSNYTDSNENNLTSSSFNNDNCNKKQHHAPTANRKQTHTQQNSNLYKLDIKLYDLNENSEHSLTETNKKRPIIKSNKRRVSISPTTDGTAIKLKSS